MALDLNDKSGNGNTLTNVGGTESTSLPFAGDNISSVDLELSESDYLYAADSVSLSQTGDVSLEAWIKLEQLPSTATSDFAIVSKYNLNSNRRSFLWRITQADKLEVFFDQDGAGTNLTRVISTNANFAGGDVGAWVHVAVTWDASAGASGVTMYKNASSVGLTTTTNLATSIADTTARFQIGSYQVDDSSNTNFFDGIVDEVRYWSDIRSGTEITNNKDIQLTGSEANLVAYYPFNALPSTDTGSMFLSF